MYTCPQVCPRDVSGYRIELSINSDCFGSNWSSTRVHVYSQKVVFSLFFYKIATELEIHFNRHFFLSPYVIACRFQRLVSYTMPSTSTTRFEKDVGNSLREINRQMTVLRDKNTKQQLEIQRLNTKLRIAAELKGVSVDDLTAAMERVAMRDMGAEVKAKLKEAEMRARKAELSKEEALALSREQQRAAQLELKIAEMTDRAKDFERMKAEMAERIQAANARAQQLQRANDQVCWWRDGVRHTLCI